MVLLKPDTRYADILAYMREGTDYLRGSFVLISTFTIFSAPMFINIMLMSMDGAKIRDMTIGWYFLTDDQKDVLADNLVFSISSTAGFAFLMYNPFQRKSYFPSKVFRDICKYIGFATTAIAIGVLPIV